MSKMEQPREPIFYKNEDGLPIVFPVGSIRKYEICKKNADGKTWSTVAWSDTWKWAKEVADSLESWNGGEFAVFKDDKKIENLDKAMKME